ncbi:MAG: LysM peptidoglycan-binding domain-containing protein [Gammaproteobacteria bacterium]
MTIRKLIVLILAALFICDAAAEPVALNPNHPQRHVVTEGDTLWDISARFLRDPWLWPEVWHANPQISNPHLIYPGDTISLVYVDGKPQLRLDRGGISSVPTDLPVMKLSPVARAEKLDRAVPTIPRDAVQQFLTVPLVVSENELARLPYIVASAGEHLVTGAGDRVYVRSITEQEGKKFNVFRSGDAFRDPDSREVLGYEAIYIGDATVQRYGDPATLLLTRTTREAAIGDRLRPVEIEENPLNFLPHAPNQPVEGRIISVVDGVTQIGNYQIVVLNRGTREGMEVGHVLTVYQTGRTILDQVKKGARTKVKLPDEMAGLLMVFRTFDKVSYALVMEAARPIHVLDSVRNPT